MNFSKKRFLSFATLAILIIFLVTCSTSCASSQLVFSDSVNTSVMELSHDIVSNPRGVWPFDDVALWVEFESGYPKKQIRLTVECEQNLGHLNRVFGSIPVQISVYSGLTRTTITDHELTTPLYSMNHKDRKEVPFPARTRYYLARVDVNGQVFWVPWETKGGARLFNRSGVPYPEYVDKYFTKERVPEPNLRDWEKVTNPLPRPSNLKEKFIEYTEKNYLNGKVMGDAYWKKFNPHHIRPLEFGGNNDFSNLIWIPVDIHKKFSAWFAGW